MLAFIPNECINLNKRLRMDTISGLTREDIRSCVYIIDKVIPPKYKEGARYILIHHEEANQIINASENMESGNYRKKWWLTIAADAIEAQLLLNDERYAILPKVIYDILFSTEKTRKVENYMDRLNMQILCHTPSMVIHNRED